MSMIYVALPDFDKESGQKAIQPPLSAQDHNHRLQRSSKMPLDGISNVLFQMVLRV